MKVTHLPFSLAERACTSKTPKLMAKQTSTSKTSELMAMRASTSKTSKLMAERASTSKTPELTAERDRKHFRHSFRQGVVSNSTGGGVENNVFDTPG